MAQGSGSYYEDYMRSSALFKHCGGGGANASGADPALGARNAKKLLTDRGAYISFLEVQLERVSAACLTTQTFEARLTALESAQAASGDKLGSLSKVLRLNQELMDQHSEQVREEAARAADKTDAWLDKLSTELRAQDARAAALEQQLQRCDHELQTLSDAAREDRGRVSSDVEELRALLFAHDARFEDMARWQASADSQLEELREIATTGMGKELRMIRSSLSDKSLQTDQALDGVRSELEQLVCGVQDVVEASVARACDGASRQLSDLRQEVRDRGREHEREASEIKGVLKKCLDTQHMLSATVVAIQREVDSALHSGWSTSESSSEAVVAAVGELRGNQEALRNALRILEACTKDAQDNARSSVQALTARLEATDEAIDKLARESIDRVDKMRETVVEALDQVELQVKADVDSVSNRAVAAVQSELGAHSSQLARLSTTMEERMGTIERGLESLQTRLHVAPDRRAHIEQHAPTPTSWNSALLDWQDERSGAGRVGEKYYLERIQELERQLHQRAQKEEERRLILQRSTQSRASPSSSSSASHSRPTSEVSEPRDSQSSSQSSSSVGTSGSGRSSKKSSVASAVAFGVVPRQKKAKKKALGAERPAASTRISSRTQAPSPLDRGSVAHGRGAKPRLK